MLVKGAQVSALHWYSCCKGKEMMGWNGIRWDDSERKAEGRRAEVHEHHVGSNHRGINGLFNSFFRKTTKKIYKSSKSLSLCEWNPLLANRFPTQFASIVESVHMTRCHHADNLDLLIPLAISERMLLFIWWYHSRNLLPLNDGNKPLFEPMLTSKGSVVCAMRAISQKIPMMVFCHMCLKSTFLKNLPCL